MSDLPDRYAEAYIAITELIGEMAWGIDLPSPMVAYMQKFGETDPQKVYAVDSRNYEPVFNAIYEKLRALPAFNPLVQVNKENADLRAQLAAKEAECKNAWETGARHEAMCQAESIKAKDKEIEAMRPIVAFMEAIRDTSQWITDIDLKYTQIPSGSFEAEYLSVMREYESKVSK